MDVKDYQEGSVREIALRAKKASRRLGCTEPKSKNLALELMAEGLEKNTQNIVSENKKDLVKGEEKGLSKAMLNRLTLTPESIKGIAAGLREIIALKDPIGEILGAERRPSGIMVGKMRVPLGVIGIIYESRPNVTADAAGLCLKAGNAVLLRGGSEAVFSNMVLAGIISEATSKAGLADAVEYLPFTDRRAIDEMLSLEDLVDVIIPRGGEGLIRAVVEKSKIPVIKHYKGICHTYIDSYAEVDMAVNIALNAKVQRPGVCNAMETLLVHEEIAPTFLPLIAKKYREHNVEMRVCQKASAFIKDSRPATEEDWHTEYLDLVISIKVVRDIDDAMNHISSYGSMHSEAIVTGSYNNSQRFISEVDAAAVFVNASTRFSDGNQFGLGAEIGISTQKLHARGPMGINELTSTKFIIHGSGQIRE